jgi:hypothetical protein
VFCIPATLMFVHFHSILQLLVMIFLLFSGKIISRYLFAFSEFCICLLFFLFIYDFQCQKCICKVGIFFLYKKYSKFSCLYIFFICSICNNAIKFTNKSNFILHNVLSFFFTLKNSLTNLG